MYGHNQDRQHDMEDRDRHAAEQQAYWDGVDRFSEVPPQQRDGTKADPTNQEKELKQKKAG